MVGGEGRGRICTLERRGDDGRADSKTSDLVHAGCVILCDLTPREVGVLGVEGRGRTLYIRVQGGRRMSRQAA